jgi:hypothetical protein
MLLWGLPMVQHSKDNKCFSHQQYSSHQRHEVINVVHKKTHLWLDPNHVNGLSHVWQWCLSPWLQLFDSVFHVRQQECTPRLSICFMEYFVKMAWHFWSLLWVLQKVSPVWNQTRQHCLSIDLAINYFSVCYQPTLTPVMAPLAMTFMDPWQFIFDE